MKASLRDLLERSPSGGGPFDDPETGKFGPDWSQQSREVQKGVPPGKLHVRETLRSGRARFHGQTETRAPAYHLFIDQGPSLSHGLSESTIEEFLSFFKTWRGHHGLKGKVSVNRSLPWGPKLWSNWRELLERESPGAVFVLSDFHGALPEGALWKILTSRFWLRVIRFAHAKPNLTQKGEFLDSVSRDRHFYDPLQFKESHQEWKDSLEFFFRKGGIDQWVVEEDSTLELARALVNLS